MLNKKDKKRLLLIVAVVAALYIMNQGGLTLNKGGIPFIGAIVNMDNTDVLGDAMVFQAEPDNALGTTEDMIGVNNEAGYSREAYIKWDISSIPAGVTINSVTMELSVVEADSPNTVDVHHLYHSYSWDESTVTWNTPPNPVAGTDYNSIASDSVSISALSRYSFDVTSIIQSCYDNSYTECNILLRTASAGPIMFRAREQGASGPSISVDYSTACTPDCTGKCGGVSDGCSGTCDAVCGGSEITTQDGTCMKSDVPNPGLIDSYMDSNWVSIDTDSDSILEGFGFQAVQNSGAGTCAGFFTTQLTSIAGDVESGFTGDIFVYLYSSDVYVCRDKDTSGHAYRAYAASDPQAAGADTTNCAAPCTPETCTTLGYECGGPYDDGCGGTITSCGSCSTGYSCQSGVCVEDTGIIKCLDTSGDYDGDGGVDFDEFKDCMMAWLGTG